MTFIDILLQLEDNCNLESHIIPNIQMLTIAPIGSFAINATIPNYHQGISLYY